MVNEIIMHLVGNLTADPELRYSQNGIPVANFTIAQTPRTFDKQSNEWKDGEAVFIRCSVWRDYAENVAATLTKGMRVIASGRFKVRSYEKDGQTRYSNELEIDEIGPSLRYANGVIQRVQRDASMTRQQPPAEPEWEVPQQQGQPQVQQQQQQPVGGADAWSTPGSFGDDTPF